MVWCKMHVFKQKQQQQQNITKLVLDSFIVKKSAFIYYTWQLWLQLILKMHNSFPDKVTKLNYP